MDKVGQIERVTQNRVVKLFQNELGYTYLGDWQQRENNSNIEDKYVSAYLARKGYSSDQINKAIDELKRVANNFNDNLYTTNKNVYQLLSEIRLNVDEQLSVCDGESEEEESPVVELEIDSILNQTIYPNPIKNNLSFSLKISQSDQKDLRYIRIFNQEGKSIIWENLYFSENKIEVKLPNSLKPGIYLLQMSFNEGGDKSQRFIIQ